MSFDEDEVVRVLRVALLCSQGSPMMRPTMSRVVGMLAGDIELNIVPSKPSYLTDWDFKDITSAFSDQTSSSSKRAHSSHHDNSIDLNKSTGGFDATHSPLNITEPMLSDLIGDGR